MKRSAAILGKTPQFVRWAVNHSCPLREIDIDDLANSTFHELRSLRTLSEGIRANRVFEGVCVHESVNPKNNDSRKSEARGFLIDEVFSLIGDRDYIDSCCLKCPANSVDGLGVAWAGCFGWLPADPGWNSGKASQAKQTVRPIEEKLVSLFSDQVTELEEEFASCFPSLPGNWYGLWMPRILQRTQLEFMLKVFEGVSQTADPDVRSNKFFWQMFDAIKRCEKSELDMHVELVPAGYSDGVGWKILAHCETCKCVRNVNATGLCPGCKSARTPASDRTQRVLGYRPYLMLKHVMGEAETVDFVNRYLNHNK